MTTKAVKRSMPTFQLDAMRERAGGDARFRMDRGTGRMSTGDTQLDGVLRELSHEVHDLGEHAIRGVKSLEKRMDAAESFSRDMADELLKQQGRPGASAGGRGPTLGQQIAKHENLQAIVKGGTSAVKMAITSTGDGSPDGLAVAFPDQVPGITPLGRKPLTIRALLPSLTTTANLVKFVRQTLRENAAAPVAEAAQKPQSQYSWEAADAPVRTIAHWVHVSRQAMDDAQAFAAELDRELTFGLDALEEAQLLSGSGVGENLEGLTTAADAFETGRVEDGDTEIDILLHAIAQLTEDGYIADGIVLHPTTFFKLARLKDNQNRYLVGSPMAEFLRQLWQTPLAISLSMEEGHFLAGHFAMAATIYDRMDTEILISSEDRDNFIKNMLTVRAEKRLALAIKRPDALVYGNMNPFVTG